MKTMSDNTTTDAGGFTGTILVGVSWTLTYISSFQSIPMLLSSIVSVLAAVHYIILIIKNTKNKK